MSRRRRLFGAPWQGAFNSDAGVGPALVLNYSGAVGGQFWDGTKNTRTFADLLTFSRASIATQRDIAGLVKFSPHNFAKNSETLQTNWTQERVSISVNAIIAPDGTMTADKIVENDVDQVHRVYIDTSVNMNGVGQQYSVYLKAAERNWFFVSAFADAGNGVYFDVTPGAGAVGIVSTDFSGTITALPNDWFLCSITNSNAATSTSFVRIGLADSDGGRSYDGDITSSHGAYAWGTQANHTPMAAANDTFADNYVPTPSGSIVYQHRLDHDKDGNRIGLLVEETRKNEIKGSGDMSNATHWTSNNLTSIVLENTYGVLALYTLTEDTTTDVHSVFATVTNQPDKADGAHSVACSIRLKAGTRRYFHLRIAGADIMAVTVDTQTWAITEEATSGSATISDTSIELVDAANGIYQLTIVGVYTDTNTVISFGGSLTGTPGAAATSYLGDSSTLIVSGIQLEFNVDSSSSYIPTTTVAVTRAAEVPKALVSGFGFNTTQGTIIIHAMVGKVGQDANATLWTLYKDANDRIMHIVSSATGNIFAFIQTPGGQQVSMSQGPAPADGAAFKVGMSWIEDDINHSHNGVAVQNDPLADIPTGVTTISPGVRGYDSTLQLNGHIKSLAYYAENLSDADLIAGTTV